MDQQPEQHSGYAADLSNLTERQIKLIRFALYRLSSVARGLADESAQDTGGRYWKPGATEAFLRDAKDAEALMAILSSAGQPHQQTINET